MRSTSSSCCTTLLLIIICCLHSKSTESKVYDLNFLAQQQEEVIGVYGLSEGTRRSQADIFSEPFKFKDSYEEGIDICSCLAPGDDRVDKVKLGNISMAFLGTSVDLEYYGFGCTNHDKTAKICVDGCAKGSTITPPPIDCDRTWCDRHWCWVDPNNCTLLNKRSTIFPDSNRFYSYATCWDMDSFTQNQRLGSLEKKILRAGFNSNSGGWLGAYSSAKTQFAGPVSVWSGPAVSFVTEAARAGNFLINITEPPEFLREHSKEYFGKSDFDFCVYATALGYLDFCVAQYTVTDQRASTTDWLLLGSQDIHLIVKIEDDAGTGFEKFLTSTKTIFKPFTKNTWIFVIFLVIPLLGGLMVVHEYGHAGSAFPKMESIVEIDDTKGGQQEIKERKVPLYRHIVRSMYIGYLSVLQQNYSQSVVTYGAMLNLLGISFFILTIIAVYTANLAAILTQKVETKTVKDIKDAVSRNWLICSERKSMEIVRALYRDITDESFIVDPPSIGGDGKPGFNCVNCKPRSRVFEFLDPSLADLPGNTLYCHVALAPLEDLDVEKQNGAHCKLNQVGDVVGQVQTGMPVYEGVSSELISLLLKLKNDGVYDKELLSARPESQCPVDDRGEGSALSIQQLTGIWVVSFGFAFAGLVVTFLMPRIERLRKKHVQSVIGYDQTGQRINMLERGDSWIHNKTIVKDDKRVFVGEDSKVGSNHSEGGFDTKDLDPPTLNNFNSDAFGGSGKGRESHSRLDDSQNSKSSFSYRVKPSRYSTLDEPAFRNDDDE